METTDYENTDAAKDKRKARWRNRGIATARTLSRRYERAAAILLRAMLVYHNSRLAMFPLKAVEIGYLHDACMELYGPADRNAKPWDGKRREGQPRGIQLATEAIAILRTIFPPLEGQDYPAFPMEAVKMAYWQCRNAAATAKQREREMAFSAEAAMATRKLFEAIASVAPTRAQIFAQAAADYQPPVLKLKGTGYGQAMGRILRAALPRSYTTPQPQH